GLLVRGRAGGGAPRPLGARRAPRAPLGPLPPPHWGAPEGRAPTDTRCCHRLEPLPPQRGRKDAPPAPGRVSGVVLAASRRTDLSRRRARAAGIPRRQVARQPRRPGRANSLPAPRYRSPIL